MVKRLIILLLLISNITVAQTYGIKDVRCKQVTKVVYVITTIK